MGTESVLNVHVLTMTWHEIGFEANLNLVIFNFFKNLNDVCEGQ
jgi:hypothetical protein